MIPLYLHANRDSEGFDHETRKRLADLLRGDLDLHDFVGDEPDSGYELCAPPIELDDGRIRGLRF